MMRKISHLTARRQADPVAFRWIALGFILMASFMELIDITIVNIAIPSIQKDLGASYEGIQWIVAAYGLAFAVFLITGGRLGDIFGRKKIFMVGAAGFTLASMLCGFAQSEAQLIVARVIQGIFAAAMVPQVLSIIHVEFPLSERGKVFGMFGAIAGLATVGGPIIGALLIEGNILSLDWRPIFLVNVPVGLICLAGAAIFVHESKSEHPLKLDWTGVFLASLGLLLLIFPIMQGRELDWPGWTFAMMASSLPVFLLFWWYERRKDRIDHSPLVVLALFKSRAFFGGLLLSLVFMSGMVSYFFIFTIFLQVGLGYSVLHAGLTGIPWSIGTAIAAGALATPLLQRYGRVILQIGALLMAGAMGSLVWLSGHYGAELHSWQLIPSLFIAGLGMGLIIANIFNFALAGVAHQHAGSATGLLETVQQLGGAVGVAVIGGIFFGFVSSNAVASAQKSEAAIRQELTAMHAPRPVQERIIKGFEQCFADRADQKDPSIVPESCQVYQDAPRQSVYAKVGDILQQAGLRANGENFAQTFRHTLYFHIGIYLLTFLSVFLLPKRPLSEAEMAKLQ